MLERRKTRHIGTNESKIGLFSSFSGRLNHCEKRKSAGGGAGNYSSVLACRSAPSVPCLDRPPKFSPSPAAAAAPFLLLFCRSRRFIFSLHFLGFETLTQRRIPAMTQYSYQRGECVLLDDGEPGVIVSAAEDGTVQVKTEAGIVVSSFLDDDEDNS